MFQKNLLRVVTLLGLPVFQGSSLAASALVGIAALYLSVHPGDDKELNLEMIKGTVIADVSTSAS